MLTGVDCRDHIIPVLAHLHWLWTCLQAQFQVLVLNFQIQYGLGPLYVKDCLVLYKPTWPLWSSSHILLWALPPSDIRKVAILLSHGTKNLNTLSWKTHPFLSMAIFYHKVKTSLGGSFGHYFHDPPILLYVLIVWWWHCIMYVSNLLAAFVAMMRKDRQV